ncbi:hypothetical protein B0I35DRAFT_408374 [Stachybotrys elegans]|uniref:RNA recognition motif-containing protein n=1 Tax=Stachybotrys elegans TaxID=80388 RepID=A0A8K0WSG4_9HYPO|nr:hypothetical protein B0I35DRAFT_408374 [Stachybotrys elegans]
MAARPGEESVATLFGDIHYFYSPPEVKPRHHRFDKGSYVYLFENARDRKCRVEIANQPGTEDQDAFDGFLDQTYVSYSYKHHCKVSLIVADNVDQGQWHLPTFDPRNEQKYHYKLHSLDIYFWTQRDALQFINGVRRVLPAAQVEVLDEPAPPPQPAGMSAIVQQLENVAVSDPQYGSPAAAAPYVYAGPPVSAVTSSGSPAPAQTQPTSFAPMAYNPAAPAAPETIRHREKTPPPDEDPLNPLSVAVAYDYQKQPFTPGLPPASQFGPGGIMSPGFPPSHYTNPPSHAALQRAATAPQGALPSPGFSSPYSSIQAATQGLPPPPPPQSQPPPQQHQQSPPPLQQQPLHASSPPPASTSTGGYSNYTYVPQAPSHVQPTGTDYSVHQQFYRPTEAEVAGAAQEQYGSKESKGRLEENAGRLERGVTGMLKKFEKRFG